MFVYCVRVLHFAEGVAYKRIQAARAARCHSEILEAVCRGDLHLTAVGLLTTKLTKENCAELIDAARHRSAEEVKQLLADREPRPTPLSSVRRVPEAAKPARALALPQVIPQQPRRAVGEPPALPPAPRQTTPQRPVTEPLGAERYRVQFVADRETHAQLEELRALMRHQIPDGDIGKILSRAIAVLLTRVRKRKFAETPAPKAAGASPSRNEVPSRHVPASIRRAVWERDGGRCTYKSAGGRRCESRDFVEFDHIEAWIWTRSHSVGDITLRCRAHNQQRARLDFGEAHMARFVRRCGGGPASAE